MRVGEVLAHVYEWVRPARRDEGVMPQPEGRLEAAVAEAFGPLLAEFGFLRVDGSEMAPEAWIRYQNDTTALTVLEEIGSPPWVKISRLDNTSTGLMEGEGYSLGHVLSARAPELMPTVARSALPLRAQLAAQAELVRRYGADMLRGNFDVFQRLRDVAPVRNA